MGAGQPQGHGDQLVARQHQSQVPEQGPDPRRGLRQPLQGVQPDQVRRRASGWPSPRPPGMKYMVLTAKHCDGFLLWHSQGQRLQHRAHALQARRLRRAGQGGAATQGMRIGWYFSPMDWRDPDFRTERNAAFLGRMQAEAARAAEQLRPDRPALVRLGRPRAALRPGATYELVKASSRRSSSTTGSTWATATTTARSSRRNADYYTPGAARRRLRRPAAVGIVHDASRSASGPGAARTTVKSLEACLDMLIRCAGGDGNVLLNVGPMPDGRDRAASRRTC